MPFAGMTAPRPILLLAVLLCACPHGGAAPTHNITAILSGSPDFTDFSAALAAANLTVQIDGRTPITVLAVDNAAMSRLRARGLPPDNLGRVLSLHVLLDYFDDAKLKALNATAPPTQSTSLFQASGHAPAADGMVNITTPAGVGDGRRGVAFSAVDSGGRVVFYEKSVKESPYDIAVLQVSDAMESPAAEGRALASSPAPTPSPAPAAAPAVAPSPTNQTAPPPKPAGAPSPANQTAPPPKPAVAPSPANQTAPPPKPTGAPPPKPAAEPAEAPGDDDQPPADEDDGHKNDAGSTAAPWSVGAVLAAAIPAAVFLLW